MYKNYFKRLFDFLAAIAGLLLLSPIFIIVTIGLFFANAGKPFFFQKRPGKNEEIFKLIKFKSMTDNTNPNGELLSNEERITNFGKIIRKTSIDEIPQLINVLKGEMSLVGPRPLKVDYLELYNTEQKKRHAVKPGITGWAQVNGRNAISHTEKFKHDVWYVKNLSFPLDMKILILTFLKVLKRDNVDKEGVNLNEPFNGNN